MTATGDGLGLDLAPPGELPSLVFDEADLAHLMATVEVQVARRVRAECAEGLDAQRNQAVVRAADALAAALAAHRADEGTLLAQAVALAEAIGQALAASGQSRTDMGAVIDEMLTTAVAAPVVRVVTGPDDAAAISALLPDAVARCGFAGEIEVTVEPSHPAGAIQLIWAEGWLDHEPEAIRRRIDTLLAPHRRDPAEILPPTAVARGSSPSSVTTNGDVHDDD